MKSDAFAIEYVAFALEFISFAQEFVTFVQEFFIARMKAGVNMKIRCSSCFMILSKYNSL